MSVGVLRRDFVKAVTVSILQGSSLAVTVEIPEELRVLDRTEQPSKGAPVFRLLTPEHGDMRVTWDKTVLNEIKAAKQMFLDLVAKGLKPFRVGTDGRQSSQAMAEFDPHAEEVIFLPVGLVAGG